MEEGICSRLLECWSCRKIFEILPFQVFILSPRNLSDSEYIHDNISIAWFFPTENRWESGGCAMRTTITQRRICLLTLSTARTDIDRFNIRSIFPSVLYRELHVSYRAVQWNLLLRSYQSRERSRVVLEMESSDARMNQLFTTEPNTHNSRSISAVMSSHGKSIASKASESRWI